MTRTRAAAQLLANRSRRAAFLCYHSIADDGPRYLSLGPAMFERQLAVLRRHGWTTGTSKTLDELVSGVRSQRPVAFLTFDDGFADNHSSALPLLRDYGMRAIVFVLPPLLDAGAPLDWTEVSERRALHPRVMRSMTWAMVDDLAAAGTEIGSHGLTHGHLDRMDGEQLCQELLDSRRRIERRVGACRMLAYPFGHWSPSVATAAAEAGYSFAVTMPRGGQWTASPWSIPRLPVDHRDDERRFGLKLSAAGRTLLLSPARDLLRRVRGAVRG